MNKRLALILLTSIFALTTTIAFCQDPGVQDSLAFGNPDGSPVQVFISSELRIPVYIKCDENVSFLHICLATENEFIPQRDIYVPAENIQGWRQYGTLPVDGYPGDGLTSQSLVAIADYSVAEPEFINTNGEWQLVCEFVMHTTDNTGAMGQISNMWPGEDPIEGVTVLFDEFFAPFVPAMVFSDLEFLEATPPVFTSPAPDTTINLNSHYPYSVTVDIIDEDEDEITLDVSCAYEDYEITEILNEAGHAQYLFSWIPPSDCNTEVPVTFTATDENNLSADLTLNIMVEPVKITVTPDTTLYGYSSSVDIYMEISGTNSNVGSFDLMFEWDADVLELIGTEFAGDFAEWEYLNASVDPLGPGSLILFGLANMETGDIPPMTVGTYHVATLNFQTSGNPDNQGYAFDIGMPVDQMNYNVLTDSSGYVVYHPEIDPAYVYFMPVGDVLIGDVNLNLLPYETGDVVVFVDHLVDPGESPFNAAQRYASDCNQDLIPATVADLIFMLNVINNGQISGSVVEGESPELEFDPTQSGTTLSLESDIPVGAVYVKVNHESVDIENIRAAAGYNISTMDSDDILTLVIYPQQTNGVVSGELLSLDLNPGDMQNLDIISVEFSTPEGALIR